MAESSKSRRTGAAVAVVMLAGSGLALVTASPAHAATISVTTLSTAAAADGQCSVVEAVQAANTNAPVDACVAGSGGDVITLPAGDLVLTAQLTFTDVAGVQLVGAGAATTSLVGDGTTRLIEVTAGALTVEDLALLDGNAGGNGGAILTDDDPVTVRDALVADNLADHGGAIHTGTGTVVVERSRFERNTAMQDALNGNGGAINSVGGDVTIVDSTFEDGFAANTSGAIGVSADDLRISGSTFTGNEARAGGAIYNSFGLIEITNSTFDGNITTAINDNVGGTIQSSNSELGTIDLLHVTITDNAGYGLARGNATTTITGSILAGNAAGDCTGFSMITSGGGNLTGDTTCGLSGAGDQDDTDPLLGPLGANGGPTATRVPTAGSPAIDAALAAECPDADQRDEPRPTDGDGDGSAACDVGAVETAGIDPLPTSSTSSTTSTSTTLAGSPAAPAARAVSAAPAYTG